MIHCTCGDPNCKVGITVGLDTPGMLWLTDKDGVDSEMYLDAGGARQLVESLDDVWAKLTAHHIHAQAERPDRVLSVGIALVGKPTKSTLTLDVDQAATLFFLARSMYSFIVAYQQREERVMADPDLRQHLGTAVESLRRELESAGLRVVEGGKPGK